MQVHHFAADTNLVFANKCPSEISCNSWRDITYLGIEIDENLSMNKEIEILAKES